MAASKAATKAKKKAKHIRSIIGRIGKKKGRDGEDRILLVLKNSQDSWPGWLKSVRLATKEEDKKGCDIVADTDVGNLYLQIKSSITGVKEFKRRQRKKMIAILISRPEMSQTQIINQSLQSLQSLRGSIISIRGIDKTP